MNYHKLLLHVPERNTAEHNLLKSSHVTRWLKTIGLSPGQATAQSSRLTTWLLLGAFKAFIFALAVSAFHPHDHVLVNGLSFSHVLCRAGASLFVVLLDPHGIDSYVNVELFLDATNRELAPARTQGTAAHFFKGLPLDIAASTRSLLNTGPASAATARAPAGPLGALGGSCSCKDESEHHSVTNGVCPERLNNSCQAWKQCIAS